MGDELGLVWLQKAIHGRINVEISGLVSLIQLDEYRVKTYAKMRKWEQSRLVQKLVRSISSVNRAEIVEDGVLLVGGYWVLGANTTKKKKKKLKQVEVIVTYAGNRAVGKTSLE